VFECLLYNPIREKFLSLFKNVVPGSLKSFFQWDQQVNVRLYLTEATALCHSRELIGLESLWCTFSPISLFGLLDLKISFISFHWNEFMRSGRWSLNLINGVDWFPMLWITWDGVHQVLYFYRGFLSCWVLGSFSMRCIGWIGVILYFVGKMQLLYTGVLLIHLT
jgi:hypothetical protein